MSPTKRLIISDTSQFEKLAFDTFNKEQGLFAPLEIQKAKKGAPGRAGSSGSVQIAWHGRAVKFLVQLKSRTAPNIVQEAFWSLNKIAAKDRENFLLVVPFITPRIREMSEEAGVSCIDLSGNYFIQRREFLAVRLDHKNRFPESTPIKKIFTGASSQVGRLFLTEKRVYTSVNEVHEAIGQLGGALSLSAVSKVLKGLADELLIEKSSRRIVLLQAERLLDRLQTAYIPPNTLSTLKLKVPGEGQTVLNTLARELDGQLWMLSGETSAGEYTMTTAPAVLRAYATQSAGSLAKFEDSRFPNVILTDITEPSIYFGRKLSTKSKVCSASRLQTYLELSHMDKRERELAQSIRDEILKEFS